MAALGENGVEMSRWREFAGDVHDMPCADGWKAKVAIDQNGKIVGIYSAPIPEYDQNIENLMAAKVTRERLKIIG